MMCEYVGCLKQLGTCLECKALYTLVDVTNPIVGIIEKAGFDDERKRILSPRVTNLIGHSFRQMRPAFLLR